MSAIATRLVRPANAIVALAVGLALWRLLAGGSRRAVRVVDPAAALLQSVAGEEDPGAALEDLRPRAGRAVLRAVP